MPKILLVPDELANERSSMDLAHRLKNEVKQDHYNRHFGDLASAIIDDAPKEFVEYPESSLEEAVGFEEEADSTYATNGEDENGA